MGKKSGGSSSTSTSGPWEPMTPYVKDVMGQAQGLYGLGKQNFPDQTFAPLNEVQQAGMSAQLNYGTNVTPGLIGQAQGAWGSALNSPDVANNPYVQDMMQQNQNMVNRNLFENLIPGAQQDAALSGGYGGSRQGVAEGIAMRGTQEALANQNAATQMDAYRAGLGAQGNAMGMTGDMLNQGFMPGQTMQNIGRQIGDEQQKYIDESMMRHAFGQDAPWDMLGKYAGVVTPFSGMQTSTQSSKSQDQSGGLFDVAAPIAGAFIQSSDARLKHNIQPIEGRDAVDAVMRMNGVTWNWVEDGAPDAGVLAQNIEDILEDAVDYNGPNETMRVNYTKICGICIEAVKELKKEFNDVNR